MLAQTQQKHQTHAQSTPIEDVLRRSIEEVTGNAFKDIQAESDLVEDLGISRPELTIIVTKAQKQLEIELSSHALREILEAECVQDLFDIFRDEYEF